MASTFISIFENTKFNFGLKFFYGVKALLDEGDDFTLLKNDTYHNTVQFGFTYKGTRKIEVWMNIFCYGTDEVQNVTVSIYDITGKKRAGEGYLNYQLDKNVFHNPSAKKAYELSFDPKVTNPQEAVAYIRSVLNRNDRDDDFQVPEMPKSPKAVEPKEPVLAQ